MNCAYEKIFSNKYRKISRCKTLHHFTVYIRMALLLNPIAGLHPIKNNSYFIHSQKNSVNFIGLQLRTAYDDDGEGG